jgi:hypothetical protein
MSKRASKSRFRFTASNTKAEHLNKIVFRFQNKSNLKWLSPPSGFNSIIEQLQRKALNEQTKE